MSNRGAIRASLAAALTSALPQASAIYDHATSDFEGQSPVVRVLSGGTNWQPPTLGPRTHHFWVQVWVVYAQPPYSTESEAEAQLDALASALHDWLDTHAAVGFGWGVQALGSSQVRAALVGGQAYLVEEHPLVVVV